MADQNKVDVEVAVSVTGQQDLDALPSALDKAGEQAQRLGADGQAAGKGLDATASAARGAGDAAGQAGSNLDKAGQQAQRLGTDGQSAGKGLDATASAAREAGQAAGQAGNNLDKAGQQAQRLGTDGQSAGKGLDAAASAARGAGDAAGQAGSNLDKAGQQAQRLGADGQAAGKGLDAAASAARGAGDAAGQAGGNLDKAGQQAQRLGADGQFAGKGLDATASAAHEAGQAASAAAGETAGLAAALKTKEQGIAAALALEQSEIAVQRQALELERTQQQAILGEAQARRDGAAALQAAGRLREIEVQQLDLTARGQRAQAQALEETTAARRAALAAAGQLTQAGQQELQASENTAKALRTQAAATQEAARAHRGLDTGIKGVMGRIPGLNDALTGVAKAMAGLFAVNKAVDFAKSTIDLADAYGQMAERIKMATPVAAEYDMVQRRILESANLTYRPLAEQQELYIRTADALRSLSYTTKDALDITDSFSYLLTTNAASGERAKNAIDAYGKAIQSGKVDAQAWQSIMAATPTIVDSIARATGKTAAEIRQLGVTGSLAVQDLNEGLRKNVEDNKKAAEGMSATVKDAFTRLTNTWQTYVGQANEAHQGTQKIVELLDLLSQNLDTVVSVATKAGEVMAAVWAVKCLVALKGYTAQLLVAQKETTALMSGTLAAGDKMAAGLAKAGQIAAAGWVGWEIGTFLREQFEVADKAGIALAQGLSNCAQVVASAWALVKATFSKTSYKEAIAQINKEFKDLNATYAQMYKDADRAAQAQQGVAGATEQAGNAAGAAARQWNGIIEAIAKANEQYEKNAQLLQKQTAARMAEAKTAVDLAAAFGTEGQQRQAAASAAQVQATQARALAALQTDELAALVKKRKALAELGEEVLRQQPDKKKELDDLTEAIRLRRAEAEATDEQARQAEIAAARAQVESEALKDNSARVQELRKARDEAQKAYKEAISLYEQGRVGLQRVNAAEIEAAKAAYLYRDALQDQQKAIEANARAQQAGLFLQEAALRVALEAAKADYEVAKARGDETGAMRAQNEMRRLEIELLKLQAQAKRAEAQSQLAAVEAKRAELLVHGPLSDAQQKEIDAAIKAAQVKQKEAQIADITADKLERLASAERNAGNAAGGAAPQHDKNAEAINKEADALERLGRAGGGGEVDSRGITTIRDKDGNITGYEKFGRKVDKDGWAVDASGNAIAGSNDLGTLTGIYNFLKSAGVDDEDAARRIAREFADENGNVSFLNNPGQIKYRKSKFDSLSTAVLHAAEQYTFGKDKSKGGSGSAPASPAAQQPAAPVIPAAPAAPSPGAGMSVPARTVNVNLSLNGRTMGTVPTTDAGAASMETFMRALEDAKRAGGY